MTTSVLDDVPGLGPSRRAALTEAFPTVSALRKATAEDLCAIPGIGPGVAAAIQTVLESDSKATGESARDMTDSNAQDRNRTDDAR